MRIALVHNLPSGGAKRALYEFVRRLRQTHKLDLFRFDVTDESFFDLTELVDRVDTVDLRGTLLGRLRYGHDFPRLVSLPLLRRAGGELARRIEARNYDLVFVHSCVELHSPYVLRFLKARTVYYCQEPYRGLEPVWARPGAKEGVKRLVRQLYARIDARNARCAHRILVPSYFCRETIYQAYGVFARVSHLGVDSQLFRPTGLEKMRRILAVGSLGAHKAQELIIRSAARIRPQPEVRLVYNWCEPGRDTYLHRLARDLGIRLELMPRVSDQDLVDAYNSASVLVSTSVMELFGLTVLEAMACGTPVVAVNEGGYRESIVHGETGFLVDRDEEELAAALARVLDAPALRDRLGSAARDHVQRNWTWDRAYGVLEGKLCEAFEAHIGDAGCSQAV